MVLLTSLLHARAYFWVNVIRKGMFSFSLVVGKGMDFVLCRVALFYAGKGMFFASFCVGKGMFFASFCVGKGRVLRLAAAHPRTKFVQVPPPGLELSL